MRDVREHGLWMVESNKDVKQGNVGSAGHMAWERKTKFGLLVLCLYERTIICVTGIYSLQVWMARPNSCVHSLISNQRNSYSAI